MMTQKTSSRWTLAGAVAALLLFALAAAPAWAGECVSGKSTDLTFGGTLDILTKVKNKTTPIPDAPLVPVKVSIGSEKTEGGSRMPAEPSNWVSKKVVETDPVFATDVFVPSSLDLPEKEDVEAAQATKIWYKIEFGAPVKITCGYQVSMGITVRSGKHAVTTIGFDGCTGRANYKVSCESSKEKKNKDVGWITKYTITD